MTTCANDSLPSLAKLRTINPPGTHRDVAWIWGPDDEVGRLNLLTSDRVNEATKNEVKDGSVISLNWDMSLPEYPLFNRPACKLEIKQHPSSKYIFDDELNMNIQSGSQWDGFRHFGHLTAGFLYNNLAPEEVLSSDHCGMHAVAKKGIVGRGVLLDYYRYAQTHQKPYDPLTSHAISLEELLACAEYQGTKFQVGDILIIRSGYVSRYHELQSSDADRLMKAGSAHPTLAGVEQSESMKTWLHDSYFAAVAGDAPAFEVWPSTQKWYLHEYLLACWGMLVGEMFDLEDLSSQCDKRKKFSFLFTSAPLNSRGGVASLANALAIL